MRPVSQLRFSSGHDFSRAVNGATIAVVLSALPSRKRENIETKGFATRLKNNY